MYCYTYAGSLTCIFNELKLWTDISSEHPIFIKTVASLTNKRLTQSTIDKLDRTHKSFSDLHDRTLKLEQNYKNKISTVNKNRYLMQLKALMDEFLFSDKHFLQVIPELKGYGLDDKVWQALIDHINHEQNFMFELFSNLRSQTFKPDLNRGTEEMNNEYDFEYDLDQEETRPYCSKCMNAGTQKCPMTQKMTQQNSCYPMQQQYYPMSTGFTPLFPTYIDWDDDDDDDHNHDHDDHDHDDHDHDHDDHHDHDDRHNYDNGYVEKDVKESYRYANFPKDSAYILRKIEQLNPGVLNRLVACGMPYPEARRYLLRVIKLTLMYSKD